MNDWCHFRVAWGQHCRGFPVWIVLLACCWHATRRVSDAQDWPQFRGPAGQGHSTVRQLPLKWSEGADNVAWKVEVDGLGWSSPVIGGRQLWLTTARDEGRSLRALCYEVGSGRLLHDVELFRREEAGQIHPKNSHASPTPIVDGDRVYVHFGAYGTAGLSTAGEVLWRQKLDYSQVHGPGGSPTLHQGLLIINCDGGDTQFVVALEADSGKIRWRTDRPENTYAKKFAFCTSLVIDVDGTSQAISPGAGGVSSYDPKSGREIWRVDYAEGYSVVPRPVHGLGMVYLSSSFDKPRLLAIRTGGTGNVTKSHVAWTLERGAPHSPSPLLVGDELYLVSDRGIASCVNARTGDIHWQERLGGNFSASPLFAAGRIYFLDEAGKTTVVAPAKEFRELAVNSIAGRTLASPVPVEGALFLRTDSHLYRVEAERD